MALPERAGSSQARAQSRREEPRPREPASAAHAGRSCPATPPRAQGLPSPPPTSRWSAPGSPGVAAALELKRHGLRVTLLERSRLLGGKATSFPLGDVEMDSGQHAILGCYTSFLELAGELGMRGDLRLQERFDVLMLTAHGRARLRALRLPAPLHLALPFLGFRALAVRARLQVVRALLAARRPHRARTRRPSPSGCSGMARASRRCRGFWEPFLIPALNAPFDRVSAASGLMVVRTALLGDRDAARIGYCHGAPGPLRGAGGRALRRGAAAHPGDRAGRRGREAARPAGGRAWRSACDAAVLAVPPERLLRIAGADALGVTGLDRPSPPSRSSTSISGTSGRGGCHRHRDPLADLDFAAMVGSPVQWIFAKGPGYLCCSLSSADDLILQPEERLVALADAELRARLPELDGAAGCCTGSPSATRRRPSCPPRGCTAPARRPPSTTRSWPGAGPTPAGRRPWRARCAAAGQAARTLIGSLVARHA